MTSIYNSGSVTGIDPVLTARQRLTSPGYICASVNDDTTVILVH